MPSLSRAPSMGRLADWVGDCRRPLRWLTAGTKQGVRVAPSGTTGGYDQERCGGPADLRVGADSDLFSRSKQCRNRRPFCSISIRGWRWGSSQGLIRLRSRSCTIKS